MPGATGITRATSYENEACGYLMIRLLTTSVRRRAPKEDVADEHNHGNPQDSRTDQQKEQMAEDVLQTVDESH